MVLDHAQHGNWPAAGEPDVRWGVFQRHPRFAQFAICLAFAEIGSSEQCVDEINSCLEEQRQEPNSYHSKARTKTLPAYLMISSIALESGSYAVTKLNRRIQCKRPFLVF